MSKAKELLELIEGVSKDILSKGEAIGHGWVYISDFPTAIAHPKYGYFIVPRTGIVGDLLKKGKDVEAAKHLAFINTPKSDEKARKDLDQR
jgi:hypothetical protein